MGLPTDFDIIVPSEALHIDESQLFPPFRQHLSDAGITDPSRFDHYGIRILIRPKQPRPEQDETGFFSFFKPRGRKAKRRSFASADSLFIALETADSGIILREAYPPTTYDGGQTELAIMGNAELGADVKVAGAVAVAKIQATMKKQFSSKNISIQFQKNNSFAIWDFRGKWIALGRQPEILITCSVAKELTAEQRYLKCQRRVSDCGRAILAPKKSKKIRLPMP